MSIEERKVFKTRHAVLPAGTAYKHGLQFASGEFIVLMDADLSHHVRTQ